MTDVIDITTAYSRALVDLGRINEDVIVLDADISDSCKTEPFYASFPRRAFDLGVAEQSLPTYAAGLSLMGKIPFYNTFAVFAVHRGFDMIRQSVAYNRANVKIVGHAAGQSLGYAGPSHHTLEDISCMRALPYMVILSPSDAVEVRQMVFWMAEYDGPVYLRLSRSRVPPIHALDYHFVMGQTELLREGEDVSIYFTGGLAPLALELHDSLQDNHINAQVVNVPTIKPLQPNQILRHGMKTHAAITLEDHNIYGGLGSAIAEIYAERLQKPVQRIGIPDTFTESDDQEVLWRAYGISAEAANSVVGELLSRTN
jgi:transketolase